MLSAGIANTDVSENLVKHFSNSTYIVVFSFGLEKYLALFYINIALLNAYIIRFDGDLFCFVLFSTNITEVRIIQTEISSLIKLH